MEVSDLEFVAPGVEAWEAWRPEEVNERLKGIAAPWWVVGGWALDLWLGEETRPHEDLEIATTREHFDAFRHHFCDFRFFTAGSGEVHYLPPDSPPSQEHHQTWVLDPQAVKWRLDIFIEPGDDDTWRYRRDPTIRFPRCDVIDRGARGISYLRPEFALLFKAREPREKDAADFELALPRLGGNARERLRTMLERVYPGHSWIGRL